MKERYFSLSGNDWSILPDSEGLPYETVCYVQNGWIAARVPGNIQWDLESANLLRPLWYGDGDPELVNVPRRDWWYRKTFKLSNGLAFERQTLVFEGVDYSCDVYLNGTYLGRNEGMFKQFAFDVTDILSRKHVNTLLVRIDRMPEELLEWIVDSDGPMSAEGTDHFFVFANNKIRQTLKGLKSPANCSYDWGTNIYTIGIWKNVYLHGTNSARLDWLQVKALPDLQNDTAFVSVTAIIDSALACDCRLEVYCDHRKVTEVYVTLNAGVNSVSAEFELQNPELWWPAGYGKSALHKVQVQLFQNETLSDSAEETFGIRDIHWKHCEGAGSDFPNKFQLVLNGVPIRTMGSNFVVPDLLYARAEGKYRHFVKMAKECGMNTLRQHGGQVVFHKEFYDAADALGIMVLVDFPIGNCVPENEPAFLQNFTETIGNIVKQLRNHPSIIEWSGGNELDWYFNPNADHTALRVQEAAVYAEDNTRLFRPTCPIAGSRHAPWDYHREVTYRQFNRDIMDNFGQVPMMRYGEFGTQTPANLESWYRDIPSAHRWPVSENSSVLIRKNAVQAVGFGSNFWLCKDRIEALFGAADDLEMLIRAGQFVGAEGLRYMLDALRAKGTRVGGFTTWDYNEPWPNGAGSYVIDYDGRPVMAYYFMKQSLEPLALQLRYDDILYDFIEDTYAELLLVSDAPAAVSGLKWSYVARDRTGAVYASESGVASIAPHEVVHLGNIKINPPLEKMYGPSIVELTLQNASDSLLAERLYVFGAKGAMAPIRGILTKTFATRQFGVPYVTTGMFGGEVGKTTLKLESVRYSDGLSDECCEITLCNTGKNTAFFVELHSITDYRTDLFIDNNFAFIPPAERRTIAIHAEKNEKTPLQQLGFRVHCWNVQDDLTVAPNGLLAWMGRKDGTNREYADISADYADHTLRAANGEFCAGAIPYLCSKLQSFAFEASRKSKLNIAVHTADTDCSGAGMLRVDLNGKKQAIPLGFGRGLQLHDREQYATPKTFVIPYEGKEGLNTLKIWTENGWFTWDSLMIAEDLEV